MKPTLLILAAGMGSRYGGLKQMDQLGPSGETLMDFAVYDAALAGFQKVVFVIRRDFEEAFKERFITPLSGKIDVAYVFQDMDVQVDGVSGLEARTKPWGTAHAMLAAKDAISTPFAVINADDFYGREAFKGMAQHLEKFTPGQKGQYALMAYILKNTLSTHGSVSRGVCQVDEKNHLTEVIERKKIFLEDQNIYYPDAEGKHQPLDGSLLVSMNFWGFSPDVFAALGQRFPDFVRNNQEDLKAEFLIPEEIQVMIQKKEAIVDVLTSTASWIGVTYKEDKPEAMKKLQSLADQGEYPQKLWS